MSENITEKLQLSSSCSAGAESYPASSCLPLFLTHVPFENKAPRSSARTAL